MGYLLVSPLRRLMYSPSTVLGPFVRSGMSVLEPGPGMGFFTLELARLVGPVGRVIAVDIEPKMLASLKRRVAHAGLDDRLELRLAKADSMGLADLTGNIDFALAFAVVHEMPSARVFFRDAAKSLKREGTLLLVEPAGHVNLEQFEAELREAAQAGFRAGSRPQVRRSHAALLIKD
jgi:ubiquinone/menaquinone biosynthesis C-methylase UbiE